MGELVQYENRYYQWIKGDFIGRVETVKDHLDENGLNFVVFQSGKRINESLLLEYLIEVPEYQAKVAEQSADIEFKEEPLQTQTQPQSQPQSQSPKRELTSPVLQLLLAQKNKQEEELAISLSIQVPKKDMINILRSSFGEEIDRDLYTYISEQLNEKAVRETIENKIKKFITDYYESNS